jgi:hypothetical protein
MELVGQLSFETKLIVAVISQCYYNILKLVCQHLVYYFGGVMAFIEFRDIKKEYTVGDIKITAVDNCSFTIEKGELAVILGPSGRKKYGSEPVRRDGPPEQRRDCCRRKRNQRDTIKNSL